MVEACQDPEIPRWTFVPSPYTEQDGRAHVAAAAERLASGRTAELAVVDARTDERLGASGLVVIDWDRKAADVGYWVAAGARGRGVAGRAVEIRGVQAKLGCRGNRVPPAVVRRQPNVPEAEPPTG